MRSSLVDNLALRFESYDDLINQVDESALAERLEAPKHKSLGEHLWCVIGARESYAHAIESGNWSGFRCSMTTYRHEDFVEKLAASSGCALDAIARVTDWTAERDALLLTLSEHETMHEGQIIRHMYGVGRSLPGSWKWA